MQTINDRVETRANAACLRKTGGIIFYALCSLHVLFKQRKYFQAITTPLLTRVRHDLESG